MDADHGVHQAARRATIPYPGPAGFDTIKAPTLVFLGGKDGLVGTATAARERPGDITGCEVEVLPEPGTS